MSAARGFRSARAQLSPSIGSLSGAYRAVLAAAGLVIFIVGWELIGRADCSAAPGRRSPRC